MAGPDSEDVLRARVLAALADGGIDAHLAELDEPVRAHLDHVRAGAAPLRTDVLDLLTLRGDHLADGVRAGHAAGADSVVLVPGRVDAGVDMLLRDITALGEALTG